MDLRNTTIMKGLFLLLTVTIIGSCQSQKGIPKEVVNTIEQVYFESWVAGVRGGGAGINFHVNFKTPLSKDTQLEKVIFKDKEAVFSTRDRLHYTANIITKKGGRPNIDGEESTDPLPESNTAQLYFKIKGKSAIHTLDKVEEKEMLAYPAMNKPR
jgi:hypothetical protein